MRLTKEIRIDFVTAVMAGIPRKFTYTRQNAEDESRRISLAAAPEVVKQCFKEAPYYLSFVSNCSRKDPDPEHDRKYLTLVCLAGQNFKDLDFNGIAEKRAKHIAETHERLELVKRLEDVANSCLTLKELRAALPDLVSYMPEEKVVNKRSLPTVSRGLIDDLKQNGLKVPKGAK